MTEKTEGEDCLEHIIVGGGIAGLYCAYHLSRLSSENDDPIWLCEASDRLGGRIETWRIDPKLLKEHDPARRHVTVKDLLEDKKNSPERQRNMLIAEFGPMRIEPDHQPYLRQLLDELGIKPEGNDIESGEVAKPKWTDLVPFAPYQGPPPDEPKFNLENEEAVQGTLVDLLLLALRRVFEVTTFQDLKLPAELDSPWKVAVPWMSQNPNNAFRFKEPYDEANYFWREFRRHEYLHHKYWKRNLMQWIKLLDEPHYRYIYDHAEFRGTLFRDMGFWNLLGAVLSHMATVKLRDWASFYHLLPENPSAAAWIVFWLRALKSTDSLKGIRGGMDVMVHLLCKKLKFESEKSNSAGYVVYEEGPKGKTRIGLQLKHKLIKVEQGTDEAKNDILLTFEVWSYNEVEKCERVTLRKVRVKGHAILALPKSALQDIEFVGDATSKTPDLLHKIFDSVSVIPLLKCFFVVDNPFWEDNRPVSRYAHTTPTRELHYWKSSDKQTGLLMIYTDRPGTQFWSDYLVRDLKAELSSTSAGQGKLVLAHRRQEHALTWGWSDPAKWPKENQDHGCAHDDWEVMKFENDRLLRTFLLYVQHDGAESVTADRVVAAGMHDWGLKPYEGACHAWRPGSSATEIIEYLSAFSLLTKDRGGASEKSKRIHVCGEAYSDFHGFIEGALRSAALVLTMKPFSIANETLTGAPSGESKLPRTIIIPRHERSRSPGDRR